MDEISIGFEFLFFSFGDGRSTSFLHFSIADGMGGKWDALS